MDKIWIRKMVMVFKLDMIILFIIRGRVYFLKNIYFVFVFIFLLKNYIKCYLFLIWLIIFLKIIKNDKNISYFCFSKEMFYCYFFYKSINVNVK